MAQTDSGDSAGARPNGLAAWIAENRLVDVVRGHHYPSPRREGFCICGRVDTHDEPCCYKQAADDAERNLAATPPRRSSRRRQQR